MGKKYKLIAFFLCMFFGIITAFGGNVYPPNYLYVPTLGTDESSILLLWDKPEINEDIVDYNIYVNGKFAGSAKDNFRMNSSYTYAFMKAFYENNTDDFHPEIDIHHIKITNLKPNTTYKIFVRSVSSDGKESENSPEIEVKTNPSPVILNILDYGAVDTGRITDYTLGDNNEKIIKNTKAIQQAIDDCPKGGKVVIPAGTYTTGAIWLKSDITLEIQEGATLVGSPNADHYTFNHLLYDYSTDTRRWALINAYSKDGKELKNIRIVGKGTIDGNGWKYCTADGKLISEVMVPQTKNELDPKDDIYNLPRYIAGNNVKVTDGDSTNKEPFGILAADAVNKSKNLGYSVSEAYSTRPSLMIFKGVDGLYIEGVTLRNPAYHGIVFLESDNITVYSTIHQTYDTNNGDGVEFGNSKNAMVVANFFDTGDDAVNFASGMGQPALDNNQRSSSNVWVVNNFIREAHGGAIAAGSHTGGFIENILIEDNVLNLTDMPFRFKSNLSNGGGVRNVYIRDNVVANPGTGSGGQVITLSTAYSDPNQVINFEPGKSPAEFSNIIIENLTVSNTGNAVPLEVIADLDKVWHTHNNIHLKNVVFKDANKPISLKGLEDSSFVDVVVTGIEADKAWSISDCNGLVFLGKTVQSSTTNDAQQPPTWENSFLKGCSNLEGTTIELSWNPAKDNVGIEKYIVVGYLNSEKIIESSTKDTKITISNLMPGLMYEFQVVAQDAVGNRVYSNKVRIPTNGKRDFSPILLPKEGLEVILVENSVGYTWATVEFNASPDNNVRKYECLVDGIKKVEVLNPDKEGKIRITATGLKAGKDNKIEIVALNDNGTRLSYEPIIVRTWDNYDTDAPTWTSKELTLEKIDDKTLKVSWQAAIDSNEILGYRVYINGKPIKQSVDEFLPTNDKYTTSNTYLIITDLDLLNESYEIKVEAGDVWWKSKIGKAPHNWTLSGPIGIWNKRH
ncbi:MAG: fibronectin type III domain-containing protein [Candidatus Caldatribacteriota bacterium]